MLILGEDFTKYTYFIVAIVTSASICVNHQQLTHSLHKLYAEYYQRIKSADFLDLEKWILRSVVWDTFVFYFVPRVKRPVGDKEQRSGSCGDLHSEGFDAGIDAFCLLFDYTGGGSG